MTELLRGLFFSMHLQATWLTARQWDRISSLADPLPVSFKKPKTAEHRVGGVRKFRLTQDDMRSAAAYVGKTLTLRKCTRGTRRDRNDRTLCVTEIRIRNSRGFFSVTHMIHAIVRLENEHCRKYDWIKPDVYQALTRFHRAHFERLVEVEAGVYEVEWGVEQEV